MHAKPYLNYILYLKFFTPRILVPHTNFNHCVLYCSLYLNSKFTITSLNIIPNKHFVKIKL